MNPVTLIRDTRQLSGFRFFAATGVVIAHLSSLQTTDNVVRPVVAVFFQAGFVRVSFFFILSGLVLSLAYHERLRLKQMPPVQFILLRLARIFPMHWLVLIPFAWWSLLKPGEAAWDVIAAHTLLLQSWIPDARFYFGLNFVTWSISTEVVFYLVFPIFVVLGSAQLLVLSAILLVLVSAGLGFTLASGLDAASAAQWAFSVFPLTRLIEFIGGILLFRFVRDEQANRRAPRWPAIQEAAAIALLATCMFAGFHFNVPRLIQGQLFYLPALFYLLYVFCHGAGFISRAMGNVWLVKMGQASFVLYLIHPLGIALVRRLAPPQENATEALIMSGGILVTSIVLSLVIFELIDKPTQQWLRAKISQRF